MFTISHKCLTFALRFEPSIVQASQDKVFPPSIREILEKRQQRRRRVSEKSENEDLKPENSNQMAISSPLPISAVPASSSPPASAALPVRVRRSIPPLAESSDRRNPFTWRLPAGLTQIEPDLNEDKIDRWRTNGVSPEDFKYGEYDGHHTYYEGNEGNFFESVAKEYEAAGPPTGFQGLISWLFLPAIFTGLAFHVPGEYLYIAATAFTVVFCAIEMGKPDHPHNFEPEIYNMDREARDKMIKAYNTMDVWEFNEKYGELWDFTVPHDDIIKQLKSLD